MTKKRDPLMWQKVAAGVIIVAFVGIFGYLYTVVLTEAPLGEFVEGEHYVLVDQPRRIRGETVEVMEFFSYGCIHCYNFEQDLSSWVAANRDKVQFIRMPAVGNTPWRALGRAYYAMSELGILDDDHSRLFHEIHEVRRPLDTPEKLASWADGKGTTEAAFLSMMMSPAVDRQIQLADQMAQRLAISSVPSIVIEGKYLVRVTADVGPARMLDVMNYLVAKVAAEKAVNPSG